MDRSATVDTNQYGTTTITGQATALLGNKYGDYFNIQQATFLLSTTTVTDRLSWPQTTFRQNRVLPGGQETIETITTFNEGNILSDRGSSRQVEVKWKRCEDLGVGVFGEVHREEVDEGERVKSRAVKVLRRRQLEYMRVDYKKELDALIQLSQQEYVRRYVEFYSWYEDQTHIYLAMEYIPYGDLGSYIHEGMKESDASQIAYQILDGICVMHRLDLIHRDIKPANVFVVQQDPMWWVKIGDFGICKRTVTRQTSLHTQVGTQGYQAPEVLGLVASEKSDRYNSKCDIWSFGCLVFETLTGQLPFTDVGSLNKYCNDEAPFPALRIKKAGASLLIAKFVWAMLQAEPRARPTAEQAMFLLSYMCDASENNNTFNVCTDMHLYLTDCIRRKFRIPWALCSTWKEMENSLRLALSYVDEDDIGQKVLQGEFIITTSNQQQCNSKNWTSIVKPGEHVFVNVRPEQRTSTNSSPESIANHVSNRPPFQNAAENLSRPLHEQFENVTLSEEHELIEQMDCKSPRRAPSHDATNKVVSSGNDGSDKTLNHNGGGFKGSENHSNENNETGHGAEPLPVSSKMINGTFALSPGSPGKPLGGSESSTFGRTEKTKGLRRSHFVVYSNDADCSGDVDDQPSEEQLSKTRTAVDGATKRTNQIPSVEHSMHFWNGYRQIRSLSPAQTFNWESLTSFISSSLGIDPNLEPWIKRGHFDLVDASSEQIMPPCQWNSIVSSRAPMKVKLWHKMGFYGKDVVMMGAKIMNAHQLGSSSGALPVRLGRYVDQQDLWQPARSSNVLSASEFAFSGLSTETVRRFTPIIHFTDCFGNCHQLTFEDVHNWKSMKGYIESICAPVVDYTRRNYIRNSEYDLYSLELQGTIPTDTWTNLVWPGMHIYLLLWPVCEHKLWLIAQRNLKLLSNILGSSLINHPVASSGSVDAKPKSSFSTNDVPHGSSSSIPNDPDAQFDAHFGAQSGRFNAVVDDTLAKMSSTRPSKKRKKRSSTRADKASHETPVNRNTKTFWQQILNI